MRLLAIVPGIARGGTELQAFQRYRRYDRHGIQVHLFSIGSAGPLQECYQREGITVYSDQASIRSLPGHLFRSRYQVVETYGQRAHVLGRVFGRLAGRGCAIISLKTSTDADWSAANRYIEIATSPLVTAYVSNSRAGKLSLEALGIRGDRISVIPNGLELSRYYQAARRVEVRAQTRAALGIPPDAFVVICVANLRPVKAHAPLIQAFAKIVHVHSKAFLLLAGEGPEKKNIEDLVRSLDLAKRVLVLGQRSDIPDLLAASDAFVLPSRREGLPGSIMEAMASEVPVVASNVGGVSELVEHATSGLLTGPASASDIADSITLLIQKPELAKAIAQSAWRTITQYSVERQVANWIDLYQRLGVLR